ncbi:MAG: hypothetical protein AAGG46_03775 [Planctomycetota bacterium]
MAFIAQFRALRTAALLAVAVSVAMPVELAFACRCSGHEATAEEPAEPARTASCCPPVTCSHCLSAPASASPMQRPAEAEFGCACCETPGSCRCEDCGCGALANFPALPTPKETDGESLSPTAAATLPPQVVSLPANSLAMRTATDWRQSRGHPIGQEAATIFCVWTL